MYKMKSCKPATIRNLIDTYQDDPCLQIEMTNGYYIDIPNIKRKPLNGKIIFIRFLLFNRYDRQFFEEHICNEREANTILNDLALRGIRVDEEFYEKAGYEYDEERRKEAYLRNY